MSFPGPTSKLELWGGVECTVARIRHRFVDELSMTGHCDRGGDLDLVAALGLRTLRFPVLWERTAPIGLDHADWSWADSRLTRARELGLRPIVGLMHHGSGPADTNLLDPEFPTRLAAYASAVACRYPWVTAYTPINEPLTTARFSALYGHWYPHKTSEADFIIAVLNQCRASVLAMKAIRDINPDAAFVATDDLGKTYTNDTLAYQGVFDNERRWLSFDLLVGRLSPDDRMWAHMRNLGVRESTLRWFAENACAPDLLGINHYVTSDRYLDSDLQRYPHELWGGNGRHQYADVEAVRVLHKVADHEELLAEAWERYGIPLAVTEAHLGGTREHQLRWLRQVWDMATRTREKGVDIRAVTAWALLGLFDWDSLLTREAGHYEPGAFDIRGPSPRLTALGRLISELATGRTPSHPVLAGEGWWRTSSRFAYGFGNGTAHRATQLHATISSSHPIIIAGAGGILGTAFSRAAARRGLHVCSLSRSELDIADPDSVERTVEAHKPWAIINAAGFARVDRAEHEREACLRDNAAGAVTLARACTRHGVGLVTFSSDLVFDGTLRRAYVESDPVHPLSVYGASKREAERGVLQEMASALVIRTAALFGPWDSSNLLTRVMTELRQGRTCPVPIGIVSPTYVPDLVDASLDLLIDAECGIWHLANQGAMSWLEFAQHGAELSGCDARRVYAADRSGSARRPVYSALSSERGVLLSPLVDAMVRYFADSGHPVSRFSSVAPRMSVGA